jgi:hypothetical protein
VPLQAAPLAEGDYRDPALVGEAEHIRDLLPALGKDDGVGRMRSVVGEATAVTFELFFRSHDAILGDDALQIAGDVHEATRPRRGS